MCIRILPLPSSVHSFFLPSQLLADWQNLAEYIYLLPPDSSYFYCRVVVPDVSISACSSSFSPKGLTLIKIKQQYYPACCCFCWWSVSHPTYVPFNPLARFVFLSLAFIHSPFVGLLAWPGRAWVLKSSSHNNF